MPAVVSAFVMLVGQGLHVANKRLDPTLKINNLFSGTERNLQ